MTLNQKPNMDFYKAAEELEILLKEAGFSQGAHKFLGKLLEELDDPQSSWFPNYATLLEPLFKRLPDDWKKRRITDDALLRHVPYSQWHEYRDDRWVDKMMTQRREQTKKVASVEAKIEMLNWVQEGFVVMALKKGTIDGVMEAIQMALAQGNSEFIENLTKAMAAKDIPDLAKAIMERA